MLRDTRPPLEYFVIKATRASERDWNEDFTIRPTARQHGPKCKGKKGKTKRW